MSNEDTIQCGCDKRHDHLGPWWGIGGAILMTLALLATTWGVSQYQADSLDDRVTKIERQLECSPGEVFVTDHDGVEYCLDPAEEER